VTVAHDAYGTNRMDVISLLCTLFTCANMAHTRQSKPDSGLGFQVVLEIF
jgi:hypothetical protein